MLISPFGELKTNTLGQMDSHSCSYRLVCEFLFDLTFPAIQSLRLISWCLSFHQGLKASYGDKGTLAREAEPAFDG